MPPAEPTSRADAAAPWRGEEQAEHQRDLAQGDGLRLPPGLDVEHEDSVAAKASAMAHQGSWSRGRARSAVSDRGEEAGRGQREEHPDQREQAQPRGAAATDRRATCLAAPAIPSLASLLHLRDHRRHGVGRRVLGTEGASALDAVTGPPGGSDGERRQSVRRAGRPAASWTPSADRPGPAASQDLALGERDRAAGLDHPPDRGERPAAGVHRPQVVHLELDRRVADRRPAASCAPRSRRRCRAGCRPARRGRRRSGCRPTRRRRSANSTRPSSSVADVELHQHRDRGRAGGRRRGSPPWSPGRSAASAPAAVIAVVPGDRRGRGCAPARRPGVVMDCGRLAARRPPRSGDSGTPGGPPAGRRRPDGSSRSARDCVPARGPSRLLGRAPARRAPSRSWLSREMVSIEMPLGQAAEHSPMLVQPPKPSRVLLGDHVDAPGRRARAGPAAAGRGG